MGYCVQADVERAVGGAARLRNLGDWDADGTADAAVITDLIEEATAWMNRWLANRYPPATIESAGDEDVKRECAREVVYRLRESRRSLTQSDIDQHAERLEWLRDVAAGRAKLLIEPSPQKATSAEAGVVDGDTTDSLTRDKLGGAAW